MATEESRAHFLFRGSGRFCLSGGSEELTATSIARNYGPKSGEGSKNDVAIQVVKDLDEEVHSLSYGIERFPCTVLLHQHVNGYMNDCRCLFLWRKSWTIEQTPVTM